MRPAIALALLIAGGGLWPASAQDHAGHPDAAAPAPVGANPAHADHQTREGAAGAAVPPLTDADRAAAFPVLDTHHRHGERLLSFVLADRLEWQGDGRTGAFLWDGSGWVGGDLQRLWFRTEGEAGRHEVEGASVELLYGRAIARWWDLVAGYRQDARPGPAQGWAAIGVQGLAPYWFEVELTGYVGASGRTRLELDTEYDLLLTNRLVLQPRLEVALTGKADAERGVGAGLSTGELGLRLRYELRRELAPYAGVVWTRSFFGTREHAAAGGRRAGTARAVVGLRAWF